MNKLRTRSYFFFGCGICILTLGISLTILSKLGASPFDALLVGLARNVGLTVGSWEVLIAVLLIGCNSYLSKQKPELLGLVTAFITGVGIDLWLYWLSDLIEPQLWSSKLLIFSVGLIAIGLGTSIYLHTKFAPVPIDRLTLVLQTITKQSIMFTRTAIYLIFLIAAILFKGPIGIGTLLTVCLGGFILHFFMPLTQKMLDMTENKNRHPQ